MAEDIGRDLKTVFLFAGQGCQFYGMGRPLYEAEPVFRQSLDRFDEAARALLGRSLVSALFAPSKRAHDVLDDTLLSHAAIYMIEVALARTLIAKGITPDCVFGASLGEIAALSVAGVLSDEDGLRVCVAQAQALAAHAGPGAMLAILADRALYDTAPWLRDQLTLAAHNLERHFVVSGARDACARAANACEAGDIAHQSLPVSVAFHSPLIDVARAPFLAAVRGLALAPARTAVLSATARGIVTQVTADYLWDIIRRPIDLHGTIGWLDRLEAPTLVDVSPGGTMSTFVRHRAGGAGGRLTSFPSFAVVSPFATDAASLVRVERHFLAGERK
jgi:trans-AT polyketide synthase, acyltransferase and oxidoreductase domains